LHLKPVPELLGPEQIRSYQIYLAKERKPGIGSRGFPAKNKGSSAPSRPSVLIIPTRFMLTEAHGSTCLIRFSPARREAENTSEAATYTTWLGWLLEITISPLRN
jgi:hypothetical protein